MEYDDKGVLGIEFFHASHGIDLDGMPEADAVARDLRLFSDLLGRAIHLTPV